MGWPCVLAVWGLQEQPLGPSQPFGCSGSHRTVQALQVWVRVSPLRDVSTLTLERSLLDPTLALSILVQTCLWCVGKLCSGTCQLLQDCVPAGGARVPASATCLVVFLLKSIPI